jgi:putative heme iron utilization protein
MKVYLDWILKIITFLGWVTLVFTTAMVIFRIKDSLKENTLKEKFYNFINVI